MWEPTGCSAFPSDAVVAIGALELQRDITSFLRGGLYLPSKAFAAGELIIREGDPGDAAYMIVSGRCRAFRTVGAEQETLEVAEHGAHDDVVTERVGKGASGGAHTLRPGEEREGLEAAAIGERHPHESTASTQLARSACPEDRIGSALTGAWP